MIKTIYIKVHGVVQGVGFRPFIYKLATELDIKGSVNNDDQGVNIIAQADTKLLSIFQKRVLSETPPLAKITNIDVQTLENNGVIYTEFSIIQSSITNQKTTILSPDIAICSECETEMNDKDNHRYEYPLINCTNCGPRYSIINTIPYDRDNTSMCKYKMCEFCKNEYENPMSRRYHAQPISCKNCGPKIKLYDNSKNFISESNEAIKEIAKKINQGSVVAIKGLGGFHLICDAANDSAVKSLRDRKNRPTKPFAVMVDNLRQIEELVFLNDKEREVVTSKEKPIVLLKTKKNNSLSKYVAPNIDRIGLFIAYTPLHKILFRYLNNPIVATSANLSDEPIITDIDDLVFKLSNVVEYILDIERDIINACDDSVVQIVNDELCFLRVARGYAPKLIKLPKKINKKILAVGGNQKVTLSLIFEDNLILSPHIGDLNSIVSFEYFLRTLETFKRFYEFEPDVIICDKHPNYESSKWARVYADQKSLELVEIQHHYAHILAVIAEYGITDKPVLGVAFDGTGYGDDGNIWGGEFLVCDKRGYERVFHFKYFRLLGGEKAIKETKRIGLSFLFDNYSLDEVLTQENSCVKSFTQNEIKTYHMLWQKGLNSPQTSSVGRIFDGVFSLSGIGQYQSYEGESGLILESYFDENINECYSFEIVQDEIIIDKMIKEIVNDKEDYSLISSKFINTLVEIIIQISKKFDNLDIAISGGVFQNRTLSQKLIKSFEKRKQRVYYPKELSANDGSLSVGQCYLKVLDE